MGKYSIEELKPYVGNGKKYDLVLTNGNKDLVKFLSAENDSVVYEVLTRGLPLFIGNEDHSQLERNQAVIDEIAEITEHDDGGWTDEAIAKLR